MDTQLLQQIAPTLFFDVLKLNLKNLRTFAQAAWHAKVCIFWFGSFRHIPYLFLARLFGCRVLIIAGGYDVEKMQNISYGAFSQGLFSRLVRRLLFRSAHKVLAVSKYTKERTIVNAWVSPKRVQIAPLSCAAPPEVALTPWQERRNQVAILISCNHDRFLCKGLDRINELAKKLPEIEFKMAGRLDAKCLDLLKTDRAPNVEFLGFLEFQGRGFGELLNSSKVVLLTSRCESFGAALVDGALYGCKPVAFAVGALPETIGGIGRVVEHDSLEGMAQVIREITSLPNEDVHITKRIAGERFGKNQRRQILQDVVGPLL